LTRRPSDGECRFGSELKSFTAFFLAKAGNAKNALRTDAGKAVELKRMINLSVKIEPFKEGNVHVELPPN